MPDEYKHPHHGLRSIRTELYTVMSKLLSELQLFKHQIEVAIVTIASMSFGQEWKPYNKHQTPDLDTLPSMRNKLQIEPLLEAMTLNAIVEEIMEDDTTAIEYAIDGSSRRAIDSYVL